MTMKAAAANGTPTDEAGYVEAIDECLKEMASLRKQMRKTDSEIRRLRISSRRKLDETWAIIRRVQASV